MQENFYHKEFGVFSNIKFAFTKLKKYSPKLFWLIPFAFIFFAIQDYAWTFVTKKIIDILTNNAQINSLLYFIGVFFILMILVNIFVPLYNNESSLLCTITRLNVLMEKNLKVMKIKFQSLEDTEILNCYQKCSNGLSGNEFGFEGFCQTIINLVTKFGSVILGLSILSSMNIFIALGIFCASLLNSCASNLASKYCKFKVWDPLIPWWRKRYYMTNVVGDFKFAKDIRMYGLKSWLAQKFSEVNKIRYNAQKTNSIIWFYASIFSSVVWLISQICVYYYLISSVLSHSITIGNFSLYLTSAGTFFYTMSDLMYKVTTLLERGREIDDVRSFFVLQSEFENQVQKNKNDKKSKNSTEKSIFTYNQNGKFEFEFKNVSFKYPKSEKFALRDLSIKVKSGERLAVVGLNGAGKTTFINLLLRLYEPTEGTIYLNGVDIQQYELDSYFKIFSPVFQEVNLFAFPFAQNISMQSKENTDNQKVNECIENSGLQEKVLNLPKGINTEILKILYDDGIELSGGQRQKLALARALYKNAPVVILDEPTAALDAIAESKLYQDFDKLIKNKTAVYISHRLSSTQFCNNVAVFKEGKLIEYGTHKSLMEQNGEYSKMYEIQSQYYIEESELNENEE